MSRMPAGAELAGQPPRGFCRPWQWQEPATLPAREALYGGHYIRGSLSLTIASPDVGKSTLAIAELCAMASGRPLLGIQPARRLRAYYFAAQDGPAEADRKITAVVQHFRLDPRELEGWLFVGDARTTPFTIAEMGPAGVEVCDPEVDLAIAHLREHGIDVCVFDPLRWMHGVDESHNASMMPVANAFERIALEADCCVEVCHHSRKVATRQPVTVEDAAGAGALIAAARSVRVLNAMSDAEAKSARVAQPALFFRAEVERASFAPRTGALTWFCRENVALANGDNVGVATPWHWPELVDIPPRSKPRKTR